MSIVKKPPTSIQVEPVFGCNMRCNFCPNSRLPVRNAPIRQMNENVARKIAWEIALLTGKGRQLRLDMALRGEPMLHKQLSLIVNIFRQELPFAQISMVTNGYALSPASAENLFQSGMNFIYLDCYGHSYSKWKDTFMKCNSDFAVRDAKDVTHWQWHGPKKQCLVLGPDIRYEKKSTRHLVSFCKALPKSNCEKYGIRWQDKPMEQRCADPFRSMNITYEGEVLLCCRDWDAKRVMYRLMKANTDLTDYWYENTTLNQIRILLRNKIRDFLPCQDCDYNGGVYLGNIPSVGEWSVEELSTIQKIVKEGGLCEK